MIFHENRLLAVNRERCRKILLSAAVLVVALWVNPEIGGPMDFQFCIEHALDKTTLTLKAPRKKVSENVVC